MHFKLLSIDLDDGHTHSPTNTITAGLPTNSVPKPQPDDIVVVALVQLRRGTRIRIPNIRLYGYVDSNFNVCMVEIDNPIGVDVPFCQTINHLGWYAAMEEELLAIQKTRTWSLVPLPLDKHATPCKWVFKLKPLLATHARLKACLVA